MTHCPGLCATRIGRIGRIPHSTCVRSAQPSAASDTSGLAGLSAAGRRMFGTVWNLKENSMTAHLGKTSTAQPQRSARTLEDVLLRFIERHTAGIWVAIACFSATVLLIRG